MTRHRRRRPSDATSRRDKIFSLDDRLLIDVDGGYVGRDVGGQVCGNVGRLLAMMIEMHPQTRRIPHPLLAYMALERVFHAVMFVAHVNFEIIPAGEQPMAQQALVVSDLAVLGPLLLQVVRVFSAVYQTEHSVEGVRVVVGGYVAVGVRVVRFSGLGHGLGGRLFFDFALLGGWLGAIRVVETGRGQQLVFGRVAVVRQGQFGQVGQVWDVGRVLREAAHLEQLGRVEEAGEVLLTDVDLASVHEVEDVSEFGQSDILEDDDGVVVGVRGEEALEVGGAEREDEFVGAQELPLRGQRHVDQLLVLEQRHEARRHVRVELVPAQSELLHHHESDPGRSLHRVHTTTTINFTPTQHGPQSTAHSPRSPNKRATI